MATTQDIIVDLAFSIRSHTVNKIWIAEVTIKLAHLEIKMKP